MRNEDARHRRELFVAALDVPSSERAAFLHRECGDAALCAEVLELLAIEPPDIFLAPPDLVTDSRLCQVCGPYRVDGGAELTPGRQLARHVASGQLVVIEQHPLPATDDQIMMFVRTAHRVNELRHPACVRVHEHGHAAGGFWFASDHIDGPEFDAGGTPPARDLRDRLQALLSIFARVVDALGAAHRAGIAHGDVRAGRIHLDRDGRASLSGFGVAALYGRVAAPAHDVAAVCALLHDQLIAALGRWDATALAAAECSNLRELLRRTDAAGSWRYQDAAALRADLDRMRSGGAPVGYGWMRRLRNRLSSPWFTKRPV